MTRTAAALFVVLCLLAGCSPKPADPWAGSAKPGEKTANLRFLWSAEPGIDLVNGPAVLVRAYEESRWLNAFTNNDATFVYPQVSYPGYARFARKELTGGAPPTTVSPNAIDPRSHQPTSFFLFGPLYLHVLSLQKREDGRWAALYCYGAYSKFYRDTDGKFRAVDLAWQKDPYFKSYEEQQKFSVGIDLIVFDQDGTSPALPPQQGPLTAPQTDVFGNGHLDDVAWARWSKDGEMYGAIDAYPELKRLPECYDKMPDPPAKQLEILRSVLDTPPPLPAPSPGWPASDRS